MKLKFIVIAFLLLIASESNSQKSAFYIAQEIFQEYDPLTKKIPLDNPMKSFLFKEVFNMDTSSGFINSNPFLKELFEEVPGSGFLSSASSATKGIGGLDVTTFADGLAKFLVKRTKEELYVSFFENLSDTAKLPEFKILFPRTKQLVDNFKSWEYSNIINTLRETFDKDLKGLLANIQNFKNIDTTCIEYKKNVKARVKAIRNFFSKTKGKIILSALAIGDGIIAERKLPDIIHGLAGKEYIGGISDNADLNNSLRLIDILSMSVRSNSAGRSYISKAQIDTLAGNKVALQIFTGLVYQQIKNEKIVIKGIEIAKEISNINSIKNYFSKLIAAADSIVKGYKELKVAKAKDELDFTEYTNSLYENFSDFFDIVLDVESFIPRIVLSEDLKNGIGIAKETLEITHDISVRNYSGAITAALNFILKHVEKAEDKDSIKEFTMFLVKFGSFAANVVQAKSSDEVEKAIESVVLPVGSASIKKHSSFNLALNAYVGLYMGKQKQRTDKKYVDAGGVYAPVGINFSKGIGKTDISGKGNKRWSASLFVPVIDIGSLVSYRFTNEKDTLANDIKIRLNQILSPGLQLAIGIPKMPISFGGGFNWTPLLTKVESKQITVQNFNSRPFRWQLFIAVDIPLLNFYTKSK